MTKILAISDTHGDFLQCPPCDILLVAGDIAPDYPCPVTDIEKWLEELPADLVLVTPGNHDLCMSDLWEPKSKKVVNLLRGPYQVEGLVFAGYGWCDCSDLPNLAEVWARMTPDQNLIAQTLLEIPPCDILVSHSPPRTVLDNWTSHNGRTRFIGVPGMLERAVGLGVGTVVCGHCHENGGRETIVAGVRVVNTAGVLSWI